MSAATARLARAIERARGEARPLVIPYLTVGFPTLGETVDLAMAAAAAGVDALELGLPFSDPLADGPVIQAASQAALAGGVTHERAFEIAREVRRRSELPLLFMGYANPMYHYGLEKFIHVMSEAGVDGLIVPDLPHEEAGAAREAAGRAGVSWVPLIAPTTPTTRIPLLDAAATDFTYCVALTGVTGVRADLDPELPAYLERVAGAVSRPFVVGFGISKPEQVARVAPPAAGVVIGSALIRAIGAATTPEERRGAVTDFLAPFRKQSRTGGSSC
ncbi:MAG TPA: tryptophan synthase subunit alpha [Candidatus Eisenbacteria bacterium]